MHKLSVLTMFKNESLIIEEWIQHYLKEGVDHFYFIDNGSDDDYETKIAKYKDKITLVKDPRRFKKNTQSLLYNHHYLNIVKKETEWLIVCDIDEYFYIANDMTLIDFFNSDVQQDIIWVPWRLFGTKYIDTPKSLIESLLIRKKDQELGRVENDFWSVDGAGTTSGYGKSIIKTEKIERLGVHICTMETNATGIKLDLNDKLRLNHYKLISESYYKNNKCVRGGGDSGHCHVYTMDYFHKVNKSYLEIEDDVLAKKYKKIK